MGGLVSEGEASGLREGGTGLAVLPDHLLDATGDLVPADHAGPLHANLVAVHGDILDSADAEHLLHEPLLLVGGAAGHSAHGFAAEQRVGVDPRHVLALFLVLPMNDHRSRPRPLEKGGAPLAQMTTNTQLVGHLRHVSISQSEGFVNTKTPPFSGV